jgi:sRNA-binding regulator protein Hfq
MREIPSTPEGRSETLLTGSVADPAPVPQDGPPPPGGGRGRTLLDRVGGLDRAPMLQLLAYYTLLILVDAVLVAFSPTVREAFVQPDALTTLAEDTGLLTSTPVRGVEEPVEPILHTTLHRAISTLLVIVGALSLVVPVAWVYMRTKRFRYDPALVRSVIILPIVVAGIALVVKNSLALAFSLAGIVAAVRFRNTLQDPRDAVYIFLVIGIGLSAGVQALDVALVMSLAFNVVALILWRHNIGSIYSGSYARTGIPSIGDPSLLRAQTAESQQEIRARLLREARRMDADSILLVHTRHPDLARHTVQEALEESAKEWRLAGISEGARDAATLEYVLRLRRRASAAQLLAALDERWSAQVDAAEYIPFRERKQKRKKKERTVLGKDDAAE